MKLSSVFLLVLSLGFVYSQIPDCSLGFGPGVAPDLLTRCDRAASCQICNRNHLSFDWLCCEDSQGYVVEHIVTPFLIQLYFRSPTVTIGVIFFFEVLENIWASFFLDSYLNFETVMGSIFADVLQGLTGFMLAALLTYAFNLPRLIPKIETAKELKKTALRFGLIILALIHILASFIVRVSWPSSSLGAWHWAIVINMGVQALFWFLLYPFIIYGRRTSWLIWGKGSNRPFPIQRRRIFCFIVGAGLIGIELTNIGWHFMANDFFQAWVIVLPLLVIGVVVALVMAFRERDWNMMLEIFGFFLAIAAATFYIVGGVLAVVGYSIAALVLAIVALLAVLVAEYQMKMNPEDEDGEYMEMTATDLGLRSVIKT